ncbi:hypothetical protein SeMB42_g03948 [Synchytrium endobioticum]|uniref:Uncharacterized protein n=1 Tax=Synchytrium endobioticum TaxID=286115 RepID=A0A507D2Q1_9FUNG|nr:hypothetical protein SeMB42_g03948 [Synchytrium endobioticum]
MSGAPASPCYANTTTPARPRKGSLVVDEQRGIVPPVPAGPSMPVPPSPMSARAREAASALVSLTGLNFGPAFVEPSFNAPAIAQATYSLPLLLPLPTPATCHLVPKWTAPIIPMPSTGMRQPPGSASPLHIFLYNAILCGRDHPGSFLTRQEQLINKAALELALTDPSLLSNRNSLRQRATDLVHAATDDRSDSLLARCPLSVHPETLRLLNVTNPQQIQGMYWTNQPFEMQHHLWLESKQRKKEKTSWHTPIRHSNSTTQKKGEAQVSPAPLVANTCRQAPSTENVNTITPFASTTPSTSTTVQVTDTDTHNKSTNPRKRPGTTKSNSRRVVAKYSEGDSETRVGDALDEAAPVFNHVSTAGSAGATPPLDQISEFWEAWGATQQEEVATYTQVTPQPSLLLPPQDIPNSLSPKLMTPVL